MRRPLETQISELQTQVAQKKAKLEQLRRRQVQEARKQDTRRKILAGAVVLKAAERDPEFAAELRSLLERGLTAARDRALFDLVTAANDDARENAISPEKPPAQAADR